MALVLLGVTDAQGNVNPFDYGSNPTFTLVFAQNGVDTAPGAVAVKVTDPNGSQTTPSTSLVGGTVSSYSFQITGGLTVAGRWTGRGYAPPGAGQASVDFEFYVSGSANP